MSGFASIFEEITGISNPIKLPSVDVLLREIRKLNEILNQLGEVHNFIESMEAANEPRAEIRIDDKVFYWKFDAILAEAREHREAHIKAFRAQKALIDRMATIVERHAAGCE